MLNPLDCEFEPLLEARPCGWQCRVCRWVTRKGYHVAPARNCPLKRLGGMRPWLAGDWLARALQFATYQRLEIGDKCGCKGRQAALNRWSVAKQIAMVKKWRLFVGAFTAWGRAMYLTIRR